MCIRDSDPATAVAAAGKLYAKQEGKELKRIFSDLIKENEEVKLIMNNSLQGEQFVYDLYKSSEKTIKNNSTV